MSDASDADGRSPNRLIDETSPYLLQHAYNPVDWYPWGEEALEAARAANKPLLISIGYAACHWCHVMERESFENEETAAIMNDQFVCIKVDREERPEIDAIYMDAIQAIAGQGGWPMTVFASPEGIPFFGGTYFPPADRPGLPSFRAVMGGVSRAWRESGEQVVEEGKRLVKQIAAMNTPPKGKGELTEDTLLNTVTQLARTFDDTYGGFGSSTKFPQPPSLELLLRMAHRGVVDAATMAHKTLRSMALGGIYDQIGGGFARYTVERTWLIPHFEKMLYDNAQLARVYTRAWQLDGSPLYRRTAVETLEYLLRDMRDPTGVFYASEDADSEGEEGKFYVFYYDEVAAEAPEALDYYGVTPDGNFEGANVLTAGGDEPPEEARRKLFDFRAGRVRPGRDEKALTSWNGLAIGALAEAGMAFDRPDFLEAAEKAAGFFLDNVHDSSGRLLHSYKDGRSRVTGLLEDYAYLAEGLLTLWEATFDPRWLDASLDLTRTMLDLFWDEEGGGLFTTGNDHEKLILRQKELTESVTPSPNAIAALTLLKLSMLTGDESLAERAGEILEMAKAYITGAPQAVCSFLCALDFQLSVPKEIVIVGDRAEAKPLIDEIWSRYLPNKVVAGAPPGIESPLLEGKSAIRGKPTAFVCEHYACQAPTNDPQVLAKALS